MSKETELAWAAVRECNEAMKAADVILAMPPQEGWYEIPRAEWVEYTRCLKYVADRHEYSGAAGSHFHAFYREFTAESHYGKVEREIMIIVMEALEIHHTTLMYIYEGSK